MRSALLVGLSTLLASGAAVAQGQDHGLRIVGMEGQANAVLTLVRVLDPKLDGALQGVLGAGSFQIDLLDGKASIQSVQRAVDLKRSTHTVVAIDHTGSFKPFAKDSWKLAQAVVDGHRAGNTMSLLVFGYATAKHYPARTSPADFLADVEDAKKVPWESVTRLYSHLADAVDKVASERATALKRVIVMTDGDEEGKYPRETLIAKARDQGVRIHALVFLLKPTPTRAANIDALKIISEKTGGEFAEVRGYTSARAKIDAWRTLTDDYLAIQSTFSCLTKDSSDNSVSVTYAPAGGRQAWTGNFAFSESPQAALYECPDKCVDCPTHQEPNAACDACVAKPCTSDAGCGAGNRCEGSKCAAGSGPLSAPAQTVPPWVWWMLGAVAVLLVVLLAVLARRRERAFEVAEEPADESAEVPAPQPDVSPDPSPAPPPPKPVTAVDGLSNFPLTLLIVKGGPLDGTRARVHKREFCIGAVSEGNDMVVDIGTISSKHAMLKLYESGAMWISDLGSANGTFVNGQQVQKGGKLQVRAGDQIGLGGEVRIEVDQPGGMKPTAEPPKPTPRIAEKQATPSSVPAPATPQGQQRPARRKPKAQTLYDDGSPSAPAAPEPTGSQPSARRRSRKKNTIIDT